MLHGAMVELNATASEHRAELTHTVSRLFLRNGPAASRVEPTVAAPGRDGDSFL
jgi:hypothetical protein